MLKLVAIWQTSGYDWLLTDKNSQVVNSETLV